MRLLLLAFLLAVLHAAPVSAAGGTLVVGSISSKPDKEIKAFHPFAHYLAQQLKDLGIEQGKVVVAKGIPDMAEKMRGKQVDIYIDSPFPSLAVSRLTDSKILLRRWKSGQADYVSVFVVREDSPFQTLADLKGRMVAFEDAYSTSGYFLPKSALLEAGYALREYQDSSAQVGAREVGFVYSGEKETTLLWVARGKVAAGAVGLHDLEQLRKAQPSLMRVIHTTQSVPRHLVSYRKDLDENLVRRIREVLLSMEHTEPGRQVLAAFEQTGRFDELPVDAEQALASIRRLGKRFESELAPR